MKPVRSNVIFVCFLAFLEFADDSAQPFVYNAKSHEMNHTMILNAPKQRDRIANFQVKKYLTNAREFGNILKY